MLGVRKIVNNAVDVDGSLKQPLILAQCHLGLTVNRKLASSLLATKKTEK